MRCASAVLCCACVFMMMSRRRKVTEKKQDIQKSPKSLINLYSSVSVGSLIKEG